jgi:hypothetical protein
VSDHDVNDEFDSELDNEFDNDHELRALLRGGDPAGILSPADPAALSILLEDIMSADLDVRPDADQGGRATGTHGRNRLTWLVAAAAAAMIAGVGGFAVAGLSGDDDPPPQASGHRTTSPGTDASVPLAGQTTQLTAKAPQGKCAVPNPALLSQYDQAFQGTVTAITGGMVTLQATDVYNGEVGETVEVAAAPADLQGLVSVADFQVGGTYLVSAFEGSVSMCPGFSGPATGDVQTLFTEAFVR